MRLFGISLGEGNKKVGDVFTFSLPSYTTCPGASPWCLKHCYAYRYEKLRPACRSAYDRNLALAQNTEKFVETMIGVLPRILPCMRIHVSGDFFNVEYVNAWLRISSAFPQTLFWTYTRSWIVPELREPLEQLQSLPNFQLLASTDPTMPRPPKDWRVAFIHNDARAHGMLCNRLTDEQDSCLACGYCFRQHNGNVILRLH